MSADTARDRILSTAERMIVERADAASDEEIGEAAGLGPAAVAEHVGSRVDLVRSIVRAHTARIEVYRAKLLAAMGDSTDLRDWVTCTTQPPIDHLAAADGPTWFARFGARLSIDPELKEIFLEEQLTAPGMLRGIDGINRCLPGIPAEVRLERNAMVFHLTVHTVADHEHALADHLPTPRATWQDMATGLIDAVVGLYLAPITTQSPDHP